MAVFVKEFLNGTYYLVVIQGSIYELRGIEDEKVRVFSAHIRYKAGVIQDLQRLYLKCTINMYALDVLRLQLRKHAV